MKRPSMYDQFCTLYERLLHMHSAYAMRQPARTVYLDHVRDGILCELRESIASMRSSRENVLSVKQPSAANVRKEIKRIRSRLDCHYQTSYKQHMAGSYPGFDWGCVLVNRYVSRRLDKIWQ